VIPRMGACSVDIDRRLKDRRIVQTACHYVEYRRNSTEGVRNTTAAFWTKPALDGVAMFAEHFVKPQVAMHLYRSFGKYGNRSKSTPASLLAITTVAIQHHYRRGGSNVTYFATETSALDFCCHVACPFRLVKLIHYNTSVFLAATPRVGVNLSFVLIRPSRPVSSPNSLSSATVFRDDARLRFSRKQF
jgi:hypothetical protein